MSEKISIRFFNDREVRAVWDDAGNRWLFSVADIVGVLTESTNPRKYWSVLKTRLNPKHAELTTACSQLKLTASELVCTANQRFFLLSDRASVRYLQQQKYI